MSTNHPDLETDIDSPDPIIEWPDEAAAIIRDIEKHVKDIKISSKIQSSKTQIFLNLTTLEDKTFCIQISAEGFKIVGYEYDINKDSDEHSMIYETPYALLNDISVGYVQSFGALLSSKMEKLMETRKD